MSDIREMRVDSNDAGDIFADICNQAVMTDPDHSWNDPFGFARLRPRGAGP